MAFVLYNAAHANSAIKSQDGKAWIRILGFFESRQAAFQHATLLNDPKTHTVKQEIRVAPLRTFRMILRDKMTAENLIDMREKETQKHKFLLSTHEKMRSNAIKQTQENADLRKMGGVSSSADASNDDETTTNMNSTQMQCDTTNNTTTTTPKINNSQSEMELPSITRDEELRMQRFAAISIIPDYEVLGMKARRYAAESSRAQREYIKKKNFLIADKVKEGFLLPSFNDLVAPFLESNPPPPHYNIHGKKLNDVLTENDIQDPNTEVSMWLQMRNAAIEDELFKAMKLEKPQMENMDITTNNTNENEEPAVMFLGVADREDEMEAAIQKIVDTDTSMKHYDIACVAMYEWLSLESFTQDTTMRRKYRDSNLNKLHEARLAHKEEAATLEKEGASVINVN